MTLQVPAINEQDSAVALDVAETVFGQQFNETLVHQLVVKYLAGGRAGTKGQKNRSAVSGGGSKPWRQKGTGRARAGTMRGPLWRSGGVTFAAQNRNYEQKLNKKMYKAGIRSIFSELLRQERLVISDDILPETNKTKAFSAQLKKLSLVGKLLIIVDQMTDNLLLASRNMPYILVTTVENMDPISLVGAEKVVTTSTALKRIEERLQ